MDRRSFLVSSGAVLSSALLGRLEAFAASPPAKAPLSGAGIDPNGWHTLGRVQQHLFPSESQAPGATEINALSYLHFVMNWQGTDPLEPKMLRAGLEQLHKIAGRAEAGGFEALDPQGRERALRTLEATDGGTQWISLVLDYLLEALLADPVYGGNPEGIGWRWLEIQPGYQRPGPDQRYFVL